MVMNSEMPQLGGEKKSKTKEEKRTFRFEVIFSEPTNNQYTELNWKEMDKLVEDDEDEEIKVITQRLMQKYGNENNASKKASKVVKKVPGDEEDDYDFEDPFIDDSEIIDEVVPKEVTTFHGGFYINKGSLEFKNTEIIIDEEEKAFKQPIITETLKTPAFKNPKIGPNSSEKKLPTPGDKSKQKPRETSQIWKMIEKQSSKNKEKQGKIQPSPMKFYDLTSPDKKSPSPKKSTPSKQTSHRAEMDIRTFRRAIRPNLQQTEVSQSVESKDEIWSSSHHHHHRHHHQHRHHQILSSR